MFSPSNSPESVVPTVHLERWIKLTWLFRAKGQRQTCQWSRQLARHETPQHPTETFPSVSPSKPREEIWLLSTAASGHKHCYPSSYICHKCPRWEIELLLQQFMFKRHHKFAYYAAPKTYDNEVLSVLKTFRSEKSVAYGHFKSNLPAFRSKITLLLKKHSYAHKQTQSQPLTQSATHPWQESTC